MSCALVVAGEWSRHLSWSTVFAVDHTPTKRRCSSMQRRSTCRQAYLCCCRYLFDKYGDGRVPWTLRLGILTTLTAGLGMLPR